MQSLVLLVFLFPLISFSEDPNLTEAPNPKGLFENPTSKEEEEEMLRVYQEAGVRTPYGFFAYEANSAAYMRGLLNSANQIFGICELPGVSQDSENLMDTELRAKEAIEKFNTLNEKKTFSSFNELNAHLTSLSILFNKSREWIGEAIRLRRACVLMEKEWKEIFTKKPLSYAIIYNDSCTKLEKVDLRFDASILISTTQEQALLNLWKFFISDYISQLRNQAVREIVLSKKDKTYSDLFNQGLDQEILSNLISSSILLRNKIDLRALSLEFALSKYHLAAIKKHLPDLERLVSSADKLFTQLPEKAQKDLFGKLLNSTVEITRKKIGVYASALTDLTFEEVAPAIRQGVAKRVKAIESRLLGSAVSTKPLKNVPQIRMLRLNYLKSKPFTTLEQELYTLYELDLEAHALMRDFL